MSCENGQFYDSKPDLTPMELVKHLVDLADIESKKIDYMTRPFKVYEPSAGDGRFLDEIQNKIGRVGGKELVHKTHFFFSEIVAKRFIHNLTKGYWALLPDYRQVLESYEALTSIDFSAYISMDLIIGNLPFGDNLMSDIKRLYRMLRPGGEMILATDPTLLEYWKFNVDNFHGMKLKDERVPYTFPLEKNSLKNLDCKKELITLHLVKQP